MENEIKKIFTIKIFNLIFFSVSPLLIYFFPIFINYFNLGGIRIHAGLIVRLIGECRNELTTKRSSMVANASNLMPFIYIKLQQICINGAGYQLVYDIHCSIAIPQRCNKQSKICRLIWNVKR